MFNSSSPAEQTKQPNRERRNRNVVVIEKIETEANRQLKALSKKQLEVNTTLGQQLLKRKLFTAPALFEKPEVSGVLSLEQYQKQFDKEQRKEELRSYRLTQEEIDLVLDHEKLSLNDQPAAKKPNYGIDPQIIKVRLENIYEKIKEKNVDLDKKDEFSGFKTMTRHEMELEKAIASRNRDTAALNKMLLTSNDSCASSAKCSEVKNVLQEIERRVYRTSSSSLSNATCESENMDEEINYSSSDCRELETECSKCKELQSVDKGWIGPMTKEDISKLQTCDSCKKKIMSTANNDFDTDDQSVNDCAARLKEKVVIGQEDVIPDDVIKRYRLSLEEIKKIPRFKDYQPGEVNKTLYLKNLSSKVTEEDLTVLFYRFQQPDAVKIICKLLKGKMRGQAFVTFADQETAEKALELVNGYDFKGKPIIIQYAKKH